MLETQFKREGQRNFWFQDVYQKLGFKNSPQLNRARLDSKHFTVGRNAHNYVKFFITEEGAATLCLDVISHSRSKDFRSKAANLLEWIEDSKAASSTTLTVVTKPVEENNVISMQEYREFSFNNLPVRTKIVGEQVWFAGKDVCQILEISDHKSSLRNLDEDEKGVYNMPSLGGKQDITMITESGLYHLIFKSRKQEAKVFRKWVTGTILPEIRRTGSYGSALGNLSDTEKSYLAQQLHIYRETVLPILKQQEEENKSLKSVLGDIGQNVISAAKKFIG